jgi:hypothetical protein
MTKIREINATKRDGVPTAELLKIHVLFSDRPSPLVNNSRHFGES